MQAPTTDTVILMNTRLCCIPNVLIIRKKDAWTQKTLLIVPSNNTAWPTRYRTRHFFNNSNINEYTATKFEQEYVRCVGNEEECVCSVCL